MYVRKLGQLTMCRLIMFNKRRRAEIKDLKLEDDNNRPKWNQDVNQEIKMALSETDALLGNRYGYSVIVV